MRLIAALALFIVGCAPNVHPGQPQRADSGEPEGAFDIGENEFDLDVRDPVKFLREHFPAVLGTPAPGRLFTDSHYSSPARVRLFWEQEEQSEEITIESELISVGRYSPEAAYVLINTPPLSIDAAYEFALSLAALSGVSNERLVGWYESEEFRDVATGRISQIGTAQGLTYSISIRPSFDAHNPWFVLYECNFSIDE